MLTWLENKNKKRKKPKLPLREILPEEPHVLAPPTIINTRAVDFMPQNEMKSIIVVERPKIDMFKD